MSSMVFVFNIECVFHFIFSLGILHVSYAPEYETVADLREKLLSRKRDIRYNLNKQQATPSNAMQKRHRPSNNESAYAPSTKTQK